MSEIIKNGRIVRDDWQVITLGEGETAATIALPVGRVIVPLAVWQAQRETLAPRAAQTEVGVWLDGAEDPVEIAADLAQFAVVAIGLPKFSDGRGYSSAVLLRQRYGFRGELRAIGEVLRDQFNALKRCGFDALQPAAGRYSPAQLHAAIASLSDFSQPYQASVADPDPLFRRLSRAA